MKAFARFVLKRSGWIATFGTLLAFVGFYYTVLLYKNLRTNIEELLPTYARSVIDLAEVNQRLTSIESIVVLTFSEDKVASRRFVVDLAQKLEKLPKDTISSVEYQIKNELKFFKDRQSLFIEAKDLRNIKSFIEGQISYEKEIRNPLVIFSGREIPEPQFDFNALLQKYASRTSGFSHFPDGYYATPDEKIRALVAYMPGKSGDIESSLRLRHAIDKTIQELNPKTYSPDLEIKFTGNVQNLIEENAALIADLELSTVAVVVLVSIAMIVYYRSIRATFALLASLFMGTFWTFGASYFLVGYLNANSAFMASIVIGNGINFGIMFLARYLEERRKGYGNNRACYIAIVNTATSTWTAALAAGLSYGSLMLTGFRGFNQFGVIGLIGMVFCWISAYVLLPTYVTWIDRIKPLTMKDKPAPKPYIIGTIAHLVDRFPRTIWYASVCGVVLSLITLPKLKNGVIEMDLNRLRDKTCMEQGSGALYHYIHDIFRRYLSPMVVLPRNREDSRKIAARLKERIKKDGADSMIGNVQMLDDFSPREQAKKIALLKEIKSLLPPRLVRYLPQNEKNLVKELLSDNVFHPFPESELPRMILDKFTERDGSVGKMVLVENAPGRGADNAAELIEFVRIVREETDAVARGTPVAGQLPITSDMVAAIIHDGPKATFFAFLSVVLLLIVLFRNARTIALCLLSLSFGVLWLTGIILQWDLKINFLNFIALPITFGIGVDYAVNVFHRYREEGRGSILSVIRHTGGAVCLSSLTTTIGYGSLLIAGNQAFVSFGRLAVLGEITCVCAAVISLPAFLKTRDQKHLE